MHYQFSVAIANLGLFGIYLPESTWTIRRNPWSNPSIERISAEKRLQLANIDDKFRPAALVEATKLSKAPSVDNPSATRLWASYFRERSEVQTR